MSTFSDGLARATHCSATTTNIAHALDSATPLLFDSLFYSELEELLQQDGGRDVVLDLSPWSWVPTFRRNQTIVRPAPQIYSLKAAVEQRAHHLAQRSGMLERLAYSRVERGLAPKGVQLLVASGRNGKRAAKKASQRGTGTEVHGNEQRVRCEQETRAHALRRVARPPGSRFPLGSLARDRRRRGP